MPRASPSNTVTQRPVSQCQFHLRHRHHLFHRHRLLGTRTTNNIIRIIRNMADIQVMKCSIKVDSRASHYLNLMSCQSPTGPPQAGHPMPPVLSVPPPPIHPSAHMAGAVMPPTGAVPHLSPAMAPMPPHIPTAPHLNVIPQQNPIPTHFGNQRKPKL